MKLCIPAMATDGVEKRVVTWGREAGGEKANIEIVSQIAVPLIEDKKQPLGVLVLDSVKEDHFSDSDLELLNTLAELGVAPKSWLALRFESGCVEHVALAG